MADYISPGSLEAIDRALGKEESKVSINTAFGATSHKGHAKKVRKKSEDK